MKESTEAKEIFSRFKQATGAKSIADLAQALGVAQQSIYNVQASGKIPGAWFRKVADLNNISIDWLTYGTGSMHRGENPLKTSLAQGDVDIVMIPKVAARLAAGSGSLETAGKNIGMYSFRSDWIHKKGNVSQMVLMDVTGDSMQPEIKHGDMVLIDQGKIDVVAYGYYAVGVEDAIYIKQLRTKPGQLILHSLNKEYEDIVVDINVEQNNPVRIIGRVIWWCREAT